HVGLAVGRRDAALDLEAGRESLAAFLLLPPTRDDDAEARLLEGARGLAEELIRLLGRQGRLVGRGRVERGVDRREDAPRAPEVGEEPLLRVLGVAAEE